ncbi:MAG: alcohol dehydrogenase catalytic domain-containing protein [Desulfobacteraceae bacterium]|jgi:L-iditol 2-dehydrogenase
MKSAFITGINQLEIRDVPEPVVPDNGVLVKMKSAALCGTDIKMILHGHRDLSLPRVPGHEGVGVIVESLHSDFNAGDVVAVYPGIFCGECPGCLNSYTARCDSIGIFGFNRDGLFRALVPFTGDEASSLVKLSGDSNDINNFSLAEPLACCISACEKVSVVDNSALIIGAGAVGSIFSALLLSKGWKRIVIADENPDRLNNQLPYGVKTIKTGSSSVGTVLEKNEINHHFDLIVPCCPEGLNWDFWNFMNPGGAAILFSGNAGGLNNKAIDANEVHYRELVLAGSYGCNMKDFKKAIEMLEKRSIDLSFLEPYTASIEELPECIKKIKDKNIKKIIINNF